MRSPASTEKGVIPASPQEMEGREEESPGNSQVPSIKNKRDPASKKSGGGRGASIDYQKLYSDLHMCHGAHITHVCTHTHMHMYIHTHINNKLIKKN